MHIFSTLSSVAQMSWVQIPLDPFRPAPTVQRVFRIKTNGVNTYGFAQALGSKPFRLIKFSSHMRV